MELKHYSGNDFKKGFFVEQMAFCFVSNIIEKEINSKIK